MADWIDDLFDAIEDESEAVDRRRDWLLRKLDECRFQDNVHDDYVERILSSDLTLAQCTEMSTTFEANALDIRYQYAPSQRAVARWIRTFCLSHEEEASEER